MYLPDVVHTVPYHRPRIFSGAIHLIPSSSVRRPTSSSAFLPTMSASSSTAALVDDAQTRTQAYAARIDPADVLTATSLASVAAEIPSFRHIVGKVRDIYVFADKVLLISTDRQSAFDRALASIPYKGRVLTLTSVWWFHATQHIVPNHLISAPHPAAMLCKKCTVFPVEFVVRGYITGSTSTSMWTNYAKGVRDFCGHTLSDGWTQHQKLPHNMVTPTTKDDVHDELISGQEVVASGRMTQQQWDYCHAKALELFAFGQQQAATRGLILVDTKYEFGVDANGQIRLIDEIHTPDSSRYWLAHSYEERIAQGLSPENIDKEFLRLWFKDHCDPYKDAVLPDAPTELVVELSRRYILLYELITGDRFVFPSAASSGTEQTHDPQTQLIENVRAALVSK
jgi:phosphoribosylaminoimidazole-succinocarboxamide synthase